METREIGRDDPAAHRRMWEIGRDAEAAYRVHDFYWPWPTAKVVLAEGRPGFAQVALGVFDRDALVGFSLLTAPTHDNLHLATTTYYVDPDRQRVGHGRALHGAVVEAARTLGRRVLLTETYARPGEDGAGLHFARAMGFLPGLEDAMKVLDLVETAPAWAALEEEALRRSAGYTVVTWHDTVPDEHLAGYCHLNEAYNEEAPLGDLEMEREVWDEQRVRSREAQNREAGRREVSTAALTADGTMVGLTEIVVNEHAPNRGLQAGTLVLPEHRGHQLGTAMKIENQREVLARFPDCRIVLTGNAGVNVPMNIVNERIGFREVERCVELQMDIG